MIRRAAAWLLAGLALATGLALLAPLGWPFELFSHFRPQYLAAALLLATLLVLQRRTRLAMFALALAGWHALPGAQSLRAAPASAGCNGPTFTVIAANLQFSNARHEPVVAWLDQQRADLVILQEVTPAWARELTARAAYPHRHLLVRDDPYGIAVLSRWPLESVTRVDLAGDGLPSLAGVVDLGGLRVRFLGMHTHWPVMPGLARARDVSLEAAAALTRASERPVVLLGDLNLTPDSPVFDRLLDAGGLRDVMSGRAWRPTWLAGFWPLALRIDHVLASPDLCVERAEVGPSIGSDHRPVLARLRAPHPPATAGARGAGP